MITLTWISRENGVKDDFDNVYIKKIYDEIKGLISINYFYIT